MTLRTTLSCAIAGLAVAAALSFGAQAQIYVTSPSHLRTMPQQGVMMPAGAGVSYQPATTRMMRHGVHRNARSMPTNDSTPAEKAATERLNLQQLANPRTMPSPA